MYRVLIMFSSTLTEIERSFRALLKRCLHERRSCLHEMARNRALGRLQEDMNKTSFFKILADEDLSSESMVVMFFNLIISS